MPPEQRDEAWHRDFLSAVPNASLASFDPQIVTGPDTFPYLQLALPDPGPFTPFSVVHVLDHVLQAGAGLVVHTNMQRQEKPLWVFTYGSLLSYALFRDFSGDPNAPQDPPPTKSSGTVLRAVPDESYLPKYARAAIGRFMRGPFQHPDPRIGLVIGSMLRPRKSLMVNLRLKDYKGDTHKLQAAMHYLSWFLPATYSVVPLPDDWSDKEMTPI